MYKKLINEWIHEQSHDRAPDGMLHVGDVANGCTRQVWWLLRHPEVKSKIDAATKNKWRMGNDCETTVREALVAKLALPEHGGWEHIPTDSTGPGIEVSPGVIGHLDLLFKRGNEYLVGEVKSTVHFFNGRYVPWLPDEEAMRKQYLNFVHQNIGYAAYFKCKHPFIILVHRGSGEIQDYVLDLDKDYPAYLGRLNLMEAARDSEEMPMYHVPEWHQNGKFFSYLCKSCPVIECERNPAN